MTGGAIIIFIDGLCEISEFVHIYAFLLVCFSSFVILLVYVLQTLMMKYFETSVSKDNDNLLFYCLIRMRFPKTGLSADVYIISGEFFQCFAKYNLSRISVLHIL